MTTPDDTKPQERPKLFEISALVHYSVVILATSEKEALEQVSTWEHAWDSSADLIEVSDVEISDIRELSGDMKDWRDDAHEATPETLAIIKQQEDEE